MVHYEVVIRDKSGDVQMRYNIEPSELKSTMDDLDEAVECGAIAQYEICEV